MVNLNSFFISPTNFSNNKGFGGVLAGMKSGCDKGSGYQSCWIWAAFFVFFFFCLTCPAFGWVSVSLFGSQFLYMRVFCTFFLMTLFKQRFVLGLSVSMSGCG